MKDGLRRDTSQPSALTTDLQSEYKGHASQKLTEAQWNEQNLCGRVGRGRARKNCTLGLKKWCFVYSVVWIEAWSANFCSFWGEKGFQVKLFLFVSLGFCKLLRWSLTTWCVRSSQESFKKKKWCWTMWADWLCVCDPCNSYLISSARQWRNFLDKVFVRFKNDLTHSWGWRGTSNFGIS